MAAGSCLLPHGVVPPQSRTVGQKEELNVGAGCLVDLDHDGLQHQIAGPKTATEHLLKPNGVGQGLRVCGRVDDFGTEYSSFEYLRAYQVNHIKIAQSLIRSELPDRDRAATIRSIVVDRTARR
jgi:EAL domain